MEIDCHKPYYNPLLATTDDEGDENDSTSGVSTESASSPLESCNVMRTRFGNISCEDLPRPVSNPYVDSPTNYVRSLSMAFAEATGDGTSHIEFTRNLRRTHELKGSVQLTEFV